MHHLNRQPSYLARNHTHFWIAGFTYPYWRTFFKSGRTLKYVTWSGMAENPCGTPSGMTIMSPTLMSRVVYPTMTPLQEGPFRVVVTSLSGADRLPLTMVPPVISVALPDVTM